MCLFRLVITVVYVYCAFYSIKDFVGGSAIIHFLCFLFLGGDESTCKKSYQDICCKDPTSCDRSHLPKVVKYIVVTAIMIFS